VTSLLLGALIPSFLVSWLAGFYVRRHAPRWGLIDRPGGHKSHERPMPLGGGIAIWLGVLAPLLAGQITLLLVHVGLIAESALPPLASLHAEGIREQSGRLWTLLGLATVLMLLGLADDRRHVDWRVRLAVQFAVAVVLVFVWEGWRLTAFLDLPLLTGALSVLWIVALVNAFNMLDNMDGLSAGVGLIVCILLAASLLGLPELQAGKPQLFVGGFVLVLAGSLAGLLWHNHTPARIFMGDAGSYLTGCLIAASTLMATFAEESLPKHTILAPVCLLAIPLYDMASVIGIRLRHGRSPVAGDQRHFSHRLVELGLSRKHAVWTIYLATATCGMGALVLPQVNSWGAGVIVSMVCCVLAIVAILEFAATRRRERDAVRQPADDESPGRSLRT